MPLVYIAGASTHQTSAAYFAATLRPFGIRTLHSWTGIDNTNPPPEKEIWDMCLDEIELCDKMVVIYEPETVLRGAIFEAGYAVGLTKPVAVYAPDRPVPGNWYFAAGIKVFNNIPDLVSWIKS